MSLTVKASGNGDFELTPEGTYVARCFKLIDLGTQTSTSQYGTKSKKTIMISWELISDEVKMKDGQPFATSKFYTASLHEMSQLRKHLESWRGKKFTPEELEGFDLKKVLGTYCMLQIVHSSDGAYANIDTLMAYPAKDKPESVNELVFFDISNPDMNVFNSLSDKMREKIQASPEWQERQKALDKFTPDEIAVVSDEPINLDDIPL